MGRAHNIPRAEARLAGLRTYVDGKPCFCGCESKYTSNAQCVDCQIQKGRARYAALSENELAAHKARDKARYARRLQQQGR